MRSVNFAPGAFCCGNGKIAKKTQLLLCKQQHFSEFDFIYSHLKGSNQYRLEQIESLVQVIHFYQLSGVVWLHSKSCSIISSYLVPSGKFGNVSLLSTQYLQMINFEGLFLPSSRKIVFYTGNLPAVYLKLLVFFL